VLRVAQALDIELFAGNLQPAILQCAAVRDLQECGDGLLLRGRLRADGG
jgi:hypothetical protein